MFSLDQLMAGGHQLDFKIKGIDSSVSIYLFIYLFVCLFIYLFIYFPPQVHFQKQKLGAKLKELIRSAASGFTQTKVLL